MARRALMLREGVAPVWDRLLTMVFLAGLLHGLIIIGLTFNSGQKAAASAPGLEVLLVSDELPQADQNPTATYLAQRTQIGSGNTRKPVAPRNRSSSLPSLRHKGTPEGNSLKDEGEHAGSTEDERVLSTIGWSTSIRYLADEGGEGSTRDKPLLFDQPQTAEPGPDEDGPAQLRGPKRDELWVTADTRAAMLAPYLDAWRRKVERIGTLNYAIVAKVAGTASAPVVEVGITADGKLERALIRRSSGSPELDQAALAILKLASPFDPFPPELAKHYPALGFAYEWQFSGGAAEPGSVSVP
jgi:protein TonB